MSHSIVGSGLIQGVDTTVQEACEEVRRQEGENADNLLKRRFQWIK